MTVQRIIQYLVLAYLSTHSQSARTRTRAYKSTLKPLVHIDQVKNLAAIESAGQRGFNWYEDDSSDALKTSTSISSKDYLTSSVQTSATTEEQSTEGSSMETREEKRATQYYRVCTPCPKDFIRKWKNKGIKWLCAGYQRARRTFKSMCMMRYRNCQDGTMFIKLSEGICQNDTDRGRHWFYVYRT